MQESVIILNTRQKNMKNTAVDDILLTLGSWNRYEKLQFVVLMLPVLPSAFQLVSVVFIEYCTTSNSHPSYKKLGRSAEHHCAPPPHLQHFESTNFSFNYTTNSSDLNTQKDSISNVYRNLLLGDGNSSKLGNETVIKLDKCSVETRDWNGQLLSSTQCPNGFQYKEPPDRTFVSEWDLVCEKEAMSDLSQAVMGIGMCIGAFGITSLSDRYGRKKIYLASDLLLFGAALATTFAPNFGVFISLRFFTGIAQQGAGIVSYVLILEQLPTVHRSRFIQVGMFTWPLSLLFMSLIAYVTKDLSWRYTQLAIAACSLYTLIQYWLVDESLRWLLVNNKMKKAERILRKAARISGVSVQQVMEVFKEKTRPLLVEKRTPNESKAQEAFASINEEGENRKQIQEAPKESFVTSLKNIHVFKITAICCYIWFADSATYYGLIMMSGSLVNDLYLGYTVNILVEFPAGVAFLVMTSRLSRRMCMIIFHLVAGLALLVVVALTTIQAAQQMPGVGMAVVVISLIGKFGSAAGYGVTWMYTPELFPTNIRTTGLGLASLAARIGVMVMPFVRTLERHLPWAPGVIFGLLCLMVPVLILFVPEMRGQELPQTLADLEALGQSKSRQKHTDQSGHSTPL